MYLYFLGQHRNHYTFNFLCPFNDLGCSMKSSHRLVNPVRLPCVPLLGIHLLFFDHSEFDSFFCVPLCLNIFFMDLVVPSLTRLCSPSFKEISRGNCTLYTQSFTKSLNSHVVLGVSRVMCVSRSGERSLKLSCPDPTLDS